MNRRTASSLNSRERIGLIALVVVSLAAFGVILWKNREHALRPSLEETAAMRQITVGAEVQDTIPSSGKHKANKSKRKTKNKSKHQRKSDSKDKAAGQQETPRDIVSETLD